MGFYDLLFLEQMLDFLEHQPYPSQRLLVQGSMYQSSHKKERTHQS
jgi:hypothetical protein